MTRPRIIVISAPSGGGKTTLIHALLNQHTELASVITHTTRAMREGEVRDVHYHFVDTPEFEQMIAGDEFVEWARVYEQYYGTSKAAIHKILDQGKTPIVNLDWQGARNLRKIYAEQALTIFILPPNLAALETRLKARGDSPGSIAKRLSLAEDEMMHASEYDYIIINDDFNAALVELGHIVSLV